MNEDIIQYATTLSTAADALSQRVDTFILAAGKVVALFHDLPLNEEQQAALQEWNNSIASIKGHRSEVDAEVAKLDSVLPAPAPEGDPTPR